MLTRLAPKQNRTRRIMAMAARATDRNFLYPTHLIGPRAMRGPLYLLRGLSNIAVIYYAARVATYDDLASKVVLVTGGANGIGAATVRAFHAQGARVYF